MTTGEIVSGQGRSWNLLKKLGEGDAGEVFQVESLLDRAPAILKRPHRSTFTSDVVRQAAQIEREARVLQALASVQAMADLSANIRLTVPELLDQGKAGTDYGERYFIVISQASGFDLSSLARAVRFGSIGPETASKSEMEREFLAELVENGRVPDLILLRALCGLVDFFERIHSSEVNDHTTKQFGVIWNDVKPDHIYYSPQGASFTLIDWGNALFLEADGVTKDRSFSRVDDYYQFIQELGRFLNDAAPELFTRLEWPGDVEPAAVYSRGVLPLKTRLNDLLEERLEELNDLRQQERNLTASDPTMAKFQSMGQIHSKIIAMGELPDYPAGQRFFLALARDLVAENQLDEFQVLCERAGRVPALKPEKCRVLKHISSTARSEDEPTYVLMAGLNDDWPVVLWHLRQAALSDPEPSWWQETSTSIRQLQLEVSAETLTPFVALNRLIHALQATAQHSVDQDYRQRTADAETVGDGSTPTGITGRHLLYAQLGKSLKETALERWKQTEPDPPDAGLEYLDVTRHLGDAQELIPEASQDLITALNQPQAQVNIVLDAWERKEFEIARRGLRTLLLWDPDRWRVIQADLAIQEAPAWLVEIRQGLENDETLQDFVTRLELRGREMRNQVGAASWLDTLLEILKELRKGSELFEVLLAHPEARDELVWLREYGDHRPLPTSPGEPVQLERELLVEELEPTLHGAKAGALGQDQGVLLTDPLDTWAPEARGSSARVFLGFLRDEANHLRQSAVKIMRADRIDYALPLFREEVEILARMQDVPGMTRLLECGFFKLDNGQFLPTEDRHTSARGLSGSVHRYGLDASVDFRLDLETRLDQGWLPYLALERRNHQDSLLLSCDASYTGGRFLPILEGLRIAIQLCDVLADAHDRNIVYRDHKILHYYWHEVNNGVYVIDWNVSRYHADGLPEEEVQFDLVQFGARTLHHILAGRTAPGALPLGPTRPEEIEAAAHSYGVHWTYDDQRLPQSLKGVLEQVLAGGYANVTHLREDLLTIFQQLSDVL